MSILDQVRAKYGMAIDETDKTDRRPFVSNGSPISGKSEKFPPEAEAALATAEMVAAGIVPDHYTTATICRRCGPVPIFPGCPPDVLGCPWCWAGSKPTVYPEKPQEKEFIPSTDDYGD